MLKLIARFFLLLSCLLSLNVAMAAERVQDSAPRIAADQMQEQHHAVKAVDELNCKDHCASQSLASNHCGACVTGLIAPTSLMSFSALSAIWVAAPTVVLDSLNFPPPLQPPLQFI
jgi:hypothetical protein